MGGAKSDRADAKLLADLVRTDRHNHRPVAGDSPVADGIKVLARAHQNLIWARARHANQVRNALREYYPAALETFDDLAHRDALAILGRAPTPSMGARLTLPQIRAALKAGGRRRNLDAAARYEALYTMGSADGGATRLPLSSTRGFGWPTCASVIHTVLVLSSMQYQIRPPAVTSYCHCSISVPFTDRRSSEPLSGCWRWSSPTRVVGDPLPGGLRVRRGRHADLFPSLDRAAVRVAHVPTVSRRRWGNTFSPFRHRPQPAGPGTVSPLASSGLLSERASLGSAWISAVAFHSRISWVTGE